MRQPDTVDDPGAAAQTPRGRGGYADMPVHLMTHPKCLEHSCGWGHPESPDRLEAIYEELRSPGWEGRVVWHEAPRVERAQLERVHIPDYIDFVRESSEGGGSQLDPDTATSEASWEAALHAAGGAVLASAIALETGEGAFAAVRPPGHHALADRAMGFCLFNNVVVAARDALSRGGVERVLIVDWDVHHGNGTQALVEADPAIRYVSSHQWPHYPGTGALGERGTGNIWNVPMPGGLPSETYVTNLTTAIDEAAAGWEPDLLLVSAGFDSMALDPLAGFTLAAEDYAAVTGRLRSYGAPVAGVLEGGYSLQNLKAGVSAFLNALC
jgi:acetoin utilization deacetylase AcuC-like enzyme